MDTPVIHAAFVSLGLLLAPVSHSTLIARVDSATAAEARAGFSGVVLIAHGDMVILDKAYGNATAGAAANAPAFWLASDSKQFTAAAILRLAEAGRLHVTDSIGRFFSTVPSDKRAITLHQLLTHTSGLPHEYKSDGVVDRDRAVSEILRLRLRFRPGEKYSYSNDGYTVLAAVVDVASGVGFDAFLGDSLFGPAGMRHSGVWGLEQPDVRIENGRDVSYGHVGSEDWLGHNAVIRFTPDGSIVVVLSNSGDVDGGGWSSRVNRAIRRIADAPR